MFSNHPLWITAFLAISQSLLTLHNGMEHYTDSTSLHFLMVTSHFPQCPLILLVCLPYITQYDLYHHRITELTAPIPCALITTKSSWQVTFCTFHGSQANANLYADFVNRNIERSDLVAVYPANVDNANGAHFWIGSVSKVMKYWGEINKLEVVWYEEGQLNQWKPMALNRLHATSIIGAPTVLMSGFVLDQNGCLSPGILSLIEETSQSRQLKKLWSK